MLLLKATYGLLFLAQPALVQANNTIPSHATTQSAPDGRGTSDIFFSSLSIILLCTWSILHLNIPARRSPPQGFPGKIRAKAGDALRQVKWMILAMFMPEYILGKAFSDWASARITAGMDFNMEQMGKKWEIIHGYYACMGGFVLDFSELEVPETPPLEFEEICANLKGNTLSKPAQKQEAPTPPPVVTTEGPQEVYESHEKEEDLTDQISIKNMSSVGSHEISEKHSTLADAPIIVTEAHGEVSTEQSSGSKSHYKPQSPKEYIANVLRQVLDDEEVNIINVNRGRSRINLSRLYSTMWALNQSQLASAMVRGLLEDISAIPSAEDLSGLDKGDTLVKLQAIYQSVWLAVQLLARKIGGLPSAQIEIAAFAFALPSIFTYWFYLDRPQGVENVTRLRAARMPTPGDVKIILDGGPYYLWTGQRGPNPVHQASTPTSPDSTRRESDQQSLDYHPLPNDSLNWPNLSACLAFLPYDARYRIVSFLSRFTMSNQQSVPVVLGSIIGGVLFGGIHCLAWDFGFPTHVERTLWRVASLILTIVPAVSAPIDLYWVRLNGSFTEVDWRKEKQGMQWRRALTKTLLGGLLALYVLARTFLAVEILRSLFYLPDEAFQDTWSGNFPSWN